MISNDENQSTPPEMPNIEPTTPLNVIEPVEPEKPKKIKKPWSKKKKGVVIGCIIGALVLIGGAVGAWFLFFQQNPIVEVAPAPEPEPVRYYSPLTGMETTEENTILPVTAVMIENSPEARPQSGLVGKNVVFEAVAEGGITRFNVLFQEERPAILGPVRSLRAYYLEWSTGFDAAQAHVGGSANALSMIRSGGYALDIDESTPGFPIWRETTTGRYAPHNAYTSATNLLEYMTSKGKTASSFVAWERQDGQQIKPVETEVSAELSDDSIEEKVIIDTNIYANSINIPVSTGIFAVSYEYNAETNSYDRYQGGVAHNDREQGQISPDVVIAIITTQTLRPGTSHYDVTTIGSGTAYVFQNGVQEQVTWRKSSAHSNIEFIGSDGENIKLNRGQTWITAIANGTIPTWQ